MVPPPPDPPPSGARQLEAPGLPRTYEEPPVRGTVLVVAPHPDDETLGPGGTLALHARCGDVVHVLFATTGVHGDPDKRHDPEEYVALRRDEARRAAEVLGIQETTFWDFPDSCVVTDQDLDHISTRLREVVERLDPAVIYAPHEGECHSDHHFVGRATQRARRESGSTARLLGYEVWSPLVPDLLVDVTKVYDLKRQAIRSYHSQMEHTDILGATEGLNRYRSILLPASDGEGRHRAEAFVEVP